jgi:hypothetical protein
VLSDKHASLGDKAKAVGGMAWKNLKNILIACSILCTGGEGEAIGGTVDGTVTLAQEGEVEANVLYHYTTEDGLNGIMNDEAINPSLNPRYAHYGPGQYLTDIVPGSMSKGEIATRLYNYASQSWKVTHYLSIDASGLDIVAGRENVYLVPGTEPLDISGRVMDFGETP